MSDTPQDRAANFQKVQKLVKEGKISDHAASLHAALGTAPSQNSRAELAWIHGLSCPACGNSNVLFVTYSSEITCSYDKCPNPDYTEAAQAQLDAAYQRGRIDEAKVCADARRHDTKFARKDQSK